MVNDKIQVYKWGISVGMTKEARTDKAKAYEDDKFFKTGFNIKTSIVSTNR